MAEIIKFPGSNRQTEETKAPDEVGIARMSDTITIPSLRAIYDEDVITTKGITITRLKEACEKDKRTGALQGIENELANARGKFILANMPSGVERTRALVDLAKHTYAAAMKVESTELMDWAARELSLALGTERSLRVIESIRIKDEIQKRQ